MSARERKVVTVLFADMVGRAADIFGEMGDASRYVREGEALLAASA